ncbi:hypothetical protein V1J52_23240 [Streptomyces sp. TRM 70351]|uniref:hypothetical protein n=1 Tax=Streptomyces sp. TRM 70351 TaxID=3116552 RepID=UPI002E7B37F3|nr:hypothetical protein [Streptomyces sp. TRM 70351]MEE1931058.1 hypothetical protein [Streptomyces sp. TRM 70351]
MTVPVRRLRTAVLVAALLAGGVGCAGAGDEPESGGPTGSGAAGSAARALINEANAAMRGTSFSSTGTTTAFADGSQETTWDPAKGLRTVASGEASGAMYCKDGRNYLSAELLAASLAQAGQQLDVPPELDGHYVYTETGQDCSTLFEIAGTGELTPEKDTDVDGRAAKAITVTSGTAEDVYYVAASGTPYLLRMDSARDGRTSTTTYRAFGEPTDVTLPPQERTLSLEEFRARTDASG